MDDLFSGSDYAVSDPAADSLRDRLYNLFAAKAKMGGARRSARGRGGVLVSLPSPLGYGVMGGARRKTTRRRTTRKRKTIPKPNSAPGLDWVDFVKCYAYDHGQTYGTAMKNASSAWKKYKKSMGY